MTTVRDVAERAGVSAMTVSNVINARSGKVSAATVERVRAAIEELGYVPNVQARTLAGGRSHALALVYQAAPGRAALSAPYDSLFVGACEREARAAGYALMLCGTADAREMVTQLRGWDVGGAIVMATTRMAPEELMRRAGVPSVFIDAYGQGQDVTSVDIDDRGGAREAGRRLARLGHRRALVVGPVPSSSPVVRARLEGFRQGFADGGGRAQDVAFAVCEVGYDDGVAVGVRLAEQRARGQGPGAAGAGAPTAVFASGDILALGVVAGLRRGGLRVPEEMSVVGFDGLPLGEYAFPPLTTVYQDFHRAGEAMVELIVEQLKGGGPGGTGQIVIPTELIVRGSTAPRLRR